MTEVSYESSKVGHLGLWSSLPLLPITLVGWPYSSTPSCAISNNFSARLRRFLDLISAWIASVLTSGLLSILIAVWELELSWRGC